MLEATDLGQAKLFALMSVFAACKMREEGHFIMIQVQDTGSLAQAVQEAEQHWEQHLWLSTSHPKP